MYSPDEVLNEIFAVPDSDLDENSSEEEYEGESYQEHSSDEDNIEGIESDVSDTGSDNNQLQEQPCGIDHDLYMVFTGAVIIVFSSTRISLIIQYGGQLVGIIWCGREGLIQTNFRFKRVLCFAIQDA